jgi:DNA-binding response OmpR family regulator
MKANLPKILICDDDPMIHETTSLYLSKKFHLVASYSVASAKELLKKENFSGAIIDLNFEGQNEDGLVLINEI